MPGQIRKTIDKILGERARGDRVLENLVHTKLILKGINPDAYSPSSDDDPGVLDKLRLVAKDLNIKL